MPQENLTRNLNIDLLRITALFMIVMAHIVAPVYSRADFYGGGAWIISFLIISFSRLGVPLFFMISGFLLFKKMRSTSENIIHTTKRLLVPFLFWTTVTYFVFFFTNNLPKVNLNLFLSGGGTEYYFLLGLAIIYLLNPLMVKVMKRLSRNKLKLLLIVLSVITVAQTYLTFVYQLPQFTIFTYWFLGLFYFMYGQYFRNFYKKPLSATLSLIIFLLPIFINIVFVYFIRKNGFSGDIYLESYFGPTVLISSVGLFNTFMNIGKNNFSKVQERLIIVFSKKSFGIFLVHGIVLDILLHKTIINPYGEIKINILSYLALSSLLILTLSAFVTVILQKNKYGRLALGQ